jgi:hypothetical protein
VCPGIFASHLIGLYRPLVIITETFVQKLTIHYSPFPICQRHQIPGPENEILKNMILHKNAPITLENRLNCVIFGSVLRVPHEILRMSRKKV